MLTPTGFEPGPRFHLMGMVLNQNRDYHYATVAVPCSFSGQKEISVQLQDAYIYCHAHSVLHSAGLRWGEEGEEK